MPLLIKIDFRVDGHLGAWWTREDDFQNTKTTISETSIRGVLLALADQLDPEESGEKETETT